MSSRGSLLGLLVGSLWMPTCGLGIATGCIVGGCGVPISRAKGSIRAYWELAALVDRDRIAVFQESKGW